MKYEDIELGSVHVTRDRRISADEIIAFAKEYDPQPMHTDPSVADAGAFGGLIASGFHTMAVAWSLWMGHGIMEHDGQGDRVRARVTISERRLTRRGRGFIRMDFEVLDQRDSVLMSFSTTGLIARHSVATDTPLPTESPDEQEFPT